MKKGEYYQECNRTVCTNRPAIYYNHSTQMFYCVACAMLINQVNKSDALRLFGHDLCTLHKPETNP